MATLFVQQGRALLNNTKIKAVDLQVIWEAVPHLQGVKTNAASPGSVEDSNNFIRNHLLPGTNKSFTVLGI